MMTTQSETTFSLRGAMTALVTPFREGAVDVAALTTLIERQVEGGIDWLVPCGTTGESPTLTAAEGDEVLATVLKHAGGRCGVLAGAGTNSTSATIDRCRRAADAGAEVEIDVETGVVDLVDFVAVDDFGSIINPMIVEGQVHGGLAQGAGQALLEHGIYDSYGQLITGSMMDYCMPRADDVPDFKVDTTVTPCTHNPLGVKGCGEAGAIGSPAAIMNAVTDALGTNDLSMPATSEKVWRALQG